jgi:mevalonate kinase
MQHVISSAPGKLMLFGEYAVIYDKPCIVTAVDLRVYVVAKANRSDTIVVNPSTTTETYTIPVNRMFETSTDFLKDISFVMAGVVRFYKSYNIRNGLTIQTFGPKNSFGLGSSSAVTVATIKALGEYFGITLSQRELFDLSYQSVIDVQGKGSGFDVASAVYGRTLYFLAGGKVIEPLEVNQLPLIIGYSGTKVSTVKLIDAVQDSFRKYPSIIGGTFDIIQLVVEDAKRKLVSGQWNDVGLLANINQGLLDALDVNTLPLARMIFAAREAGALGAKLSGAGGGDCMFAITGNDADKVKKEMSEAGGQIVEFDTSAEGARLEEGVNPNYTNR